MALLSETVCPVRMVSWCGGEMDTESTSATALWYLDPRNWNGNEARRMWYIYRLYNNILTRGTGLPCVQWCRSGYRGISASLPNCSLCSARQCSRGYCYHGHGSRGHDRVVATPSPHWPWQPQCPGSPPGGDYIIQS